MNDSEQVPPSPATSPHGPAGQDADSAYESALELVGQVTAWYSARILTERRSGADAQRLQELISRRQACVKDQERLEDASGEETAGIVTAYEALLNELESSEQ
ncbi:hypothetical protein [Streptomyces albireticuli]|uniref:hypothetical protein n=1 Tax=Streptomyces albireticuli TaxID=1940 RepID=UPI0011808B32|nr:hypothetical protein [Streptomyces albireticuli]MCD9145486.1 hypothetical protein [Streptomyces albireticuli]MCD9164949.1 hypothetical protein [Streptomyces albireticuli]MCD9195460.1 hypothetical protein [Streptomyces albireticuli]